MQDSHSEDLRMMTMIKLPKAVIERMSYEMRQKNYNQEKDELLQKMRGATAGELADALKALVDKWKV